MPGTRLEAGTAASDVSGSHLQNPERGRFYLGFFRMDKSASAQKSANKEIGRSEPPQHLGLGEHQSNHVGGLYSLLHLQRAAGNQAVVRLLESRRQVRGGPESNQSRSEHFAVGPRTLQAKLTVNRPGDRYEQEADHIAERVMRMESRQSGESKLSISSVGSVKEQRKCVSCEEDEEKLQRKEHGSNFDSPTSAPLIVHEALKSPGQPLNPAIRAFMEPRFDQDFSGVRLHTDAKAAESARALNASAYTTGRDIVFGAGQFAPETAAGKYLLAHELTHVSQQRSGNATSPIQRFHLPHGADPKHQVDETSLIAPTFNDLLATMKAIIKDCITPGGTVNMDLFVKKAGGRSANDEIGKKLGSKPTPVGSMLNYRYLFTCRCGLIDMRHFLQLMYISHFFAGAGLPPSSAIRGATKRGREHELDAESESRFGPEDTPSNALGAFLGPQLAITPLPDDLLNEIETILRRCSPIDFSTLGTASKDLIRHHYGDLVADPAPKKLGDLIPAHQNQTAVPDVLGVPECGGKERSFPFELDTSDPDKKTIAGTAFGAGSSTLTSDSDIRDFVSTQRVEIIKGLPAAEKVRLVKRLFSGWVSDDDIDAIERIYKNSTSAEQATIKGAVNIGDLSDVGQRTRLRLLFS